MPVARINCRVRADKWWLVRTITEKQQKQSEEARYHRCNACAARGGPLLSCGAHSPMPRRISEVYGGCQSSWMLAGTRRSFRRRNDVVIFLFPLLPSASSFFPRCFSPRLAILLGIASWTSTVPGRACYYAWILLAQSIMSDLKPCLQCRDILLRNIGGIRWSKGVASATLDAGKSMDAACWKFMYNRWFLHLRIYMNDLDKEWSCELVWTILTNTYLLLSSS